MIEFSVIVPVYNASPYIGKCIESVQKQRISDWELILVDDGSVDDSLKICSQYAEKDRRIIVLHQENQGPGIARNSAIDICKGKYVIFLDADDYLSPLYFDEMKYHNEDVVFFNLQNVDTKGNPKGLDKVSINGQLSKDQFIRQQMTGRIQWGGVRKCVKSQLLKDYSIRYTNHRIGEEPLYSFFVCHYAKSITYVDKPLYVRVLRDDSQSHLPVFDP